MLTQIRDRASGWIAWVIVILLAVPFALWGIQSYFEGNTEVPVATVNGDDIPLYAFQEQLSRQRRADPSAAAQTAEMRNEILESMIVTRLLTDYVREQNYRIADDLLKSQIQNDSSFFTDGVFDADVYRNLLRANGLTPKTYEENTRQRIAAQQLSSSLSDTAFVTEREMSELLALQTQTRKADYVLLPANHFADGVEVTDADVEKQYRDNAAAFEAPARMKVEYIDLSVDNLAQAITPTDDEVAEIYEQTRERYKQAEVRKASHILFGTDAATSDEKRAELLAQAESVTGHAQAGEDFAELAEIYSDDPGSKTRGGDLGVVSRGQMVAPFEEAVFDMTDGEIRGPIETQFGYHIIKLTELSAARQQSLDEAREEVADEARRRQAENQFAELGEAFSNLVFEVPDDLTTTADELGLTVQQSDWFTENAGDGIAEEAQVRRAAFSEDVRDDALNSAAIELGFDRLVAVRKLDFEEAHTRPLDEVRAQIKTAIARNKSGEQVRELGGKVVVDLNAGELNWTDMLTAHKLESQTLPERRADAPPELAALADAVFAQSAPDADQVLYNSVAQDNGDYAIYALKEVARGSGDDADDAQRENLLAQLRARDGAGLYQLLLNGLRKNADVAINRNQLENPTSDFY